MLLTKALKTYAETTLGVAQGSSDEDYTKAISKALMEGKLTADEFAKMTAASNDAAAQIKSLISTEVKSAVDSLGSQLTSKLDETLTTIKNAIKGEPKPEPKTEPKQEPDGEKALADQLAKLLPGILEKHGLKPEPDGENKPGTAKGLIGGDPAKVLGGDDEQTRVEHIAAIKRYDGTRRGAFLKSYGGQQPLPASFMGKNLDHGSQADKAIIGAVFKWNLETQTQGRVRLNDHEKELVSYAIHNLPWVGVLGNGNQEIPIDGRKLTDFERKTLLEDNTSGGTSAVPVVFDDNVILTPILSGEFFPLVNVIPLSRGSHVQGFAMGNPTLSATAEGTDIPLFNTSSFISAFNTTIWPVVGGMTIGLDFLSDSPVDIGSLVIQRYGEQMMHWLDRVIVYGQGSGSSEPQGIIGTSGAVAVTSISGTSGPLSISDAEGLMFGVSKKYRSAKGGNKNIYFGSETMYRRFRAVRVGTADARRVFGMDHASYTLLDYPYKVCEESPNGTIGFVNLAFYRMYRRLGMQVRIDTQGQTLARQNAMLITLRARYGGQMELGAAAAIMTTGATSGPATG